MSAAPSSDAGFSAALISVRIVDVDYYMMSLDKYSPAVAFQAARLILPHSQTCPKLPTIRIFGSTPAGQKACVHLHGLRPYFYVRLPDEVAPASALSFGQKLGSALEQALAASLAASLPPEMRAGDSEETRTLATPAGTFICDIQPVMRTDIYGYHPQPVLFLRIMLYNPRFVSRLAAILHTRDGLPAEFAQYRYQPYESHMSFTFQTLTDLALTGMGYINLSTCKFRLPLPADDSADGAQSASQTARPSLSAPANQRFFTENLSASRPDLFWPFGAAEKRTVSEVELDAFAGDVLNNVDSSMENLPGQRQGPDAYAAKTLRILWDEERARIGRKPVVPLDLPRRIRAGHHLSHDRLARKVRALLDGTWNSRAAAASRSPTESDMVEDMMRFLDSEGVENAEVAHLALDDGSASDVSGMSDDRWDLAEDNWEQGAHEWDDIYESTQAHAAKIPQGDGSNGCEGDGSVRKRGKESSLRSVPRAPSSRKPERSAARRRRRVGSYQKLEFRDAEGSSVDLGMAGQEESSLYPRGTDGKSDLGLTGDAVDSGPRGEPDLDCITREFEPQVGKVVRSEGARNAITQFGPANSCAPAVFASDTRKIPAIGSDYAGSSRWEERRGGSGDAQPVSDIEPVPRAPTSSLHWHTSAEVILDSGHSDGSKSLVEPERVRAQGMEDSEAGAEAKSQRGHVVVSGSDVSVPVDCVVFRKRAPKASDILDQFGLGRIRPRLQHIAPFHSNPLDRHGKPIVGVSARVAAGGVAGLESSRSVFVEDDLVTATVLSEVVTPARLPPSAASVRADLSLTSNDSREGSVLGRRSMKMRIDSAGRWVHLGAESGFQGSAISATLASEDGLHVSPRRVPRRIDSATGGDKVGSSDESEDDMPNSSLGDFVEVTPGRVAAFQASGRVERPSSPKYDDRSFFPDTPWKARGTRSTLSGAKESPVFLRSETPRKRGGRSERESCASDSDMKSFSGQNLTVVVVEVLASCHGKRLSDPKVDQVLALCACCRSECILPWGRELEVIFVLESCRISRRRSGILHACKSEKELFEKFAELIAVVDPDILAGFETQTTSIGFLLERAEAVGHDFERRLSRMPKSDRKAFGSGTSRNVEPDEEENPGARYFRRKGANIKIPGRHVVNTWRVVRKDIKLASYSLEGVAREVLNVTLPRHDAFVVEEWLGSCERSHRALSYLLDRTRVCLGILDKLDVLGRTGELARVYGIEFMNVLTRGSQYRVESMLARVAHPRGFVLLAAQRDQVFNQPAVECIPLVMEPESGFHVDPVIVLDFQSLYPSMIIAHNLCFSTMLGNVNRLDAWRDCQQLGVIDGFRAPEGVALKEAFGAEPQGGIYCAPNGEMFVTENHRRGVLPQMLEEVLQTRVMVKSAMKDISRSQNPDEDLLKRLNARQFAAKMLANVTYGFAAASATGRMPCAGLADSIVQCGRDALERIIDFVQSVLLPETNAHVLYGDTDSLFVVTPGATRAEAFALGRRIAAEAESMFPAPVKLQLEKVFHPCFLVTKKRYVGYAYDSEECATPLFDAKGIETVRRDSCGVVQKTMEKSLRMLFELKDVSKVKHLFQKTCQRIQRNGLPLSEFIFRKEVRLGTYKKTLPPAAVVASRAIEADPRAAPRYGERVAFVVVFGGPGSTLNESVMSPSEMLAAESLGKARLHSTYYITKQMIPALDRLFCLIGVSVARGISAYQEATRLI